MQNELIHRPSLPLKPEDTIGVLILDADGTAIAESSWLELTKIIGGSEAEHIRIFVNEYLNKIVGLAVSNSKQLYLEMKRKLIAHWIEARGGKHITKREIEAAFKYIAHRVRAEVLEAVELGLSYGFVSVVATGSSDMLAKALVKRMRLFELLDSSFKGLELDHSNSQFIFDENDIFVDFDYEVNEPHLKAQEISVFLVELTRLINQHKPADKQINPSELIVIPIGDDESDFWLWMMFKGIYLDIKNKQLYRKRVDFTVEKLPDLVPILEKLIIQRITEQQKRKELKRDHKDNHDNHTEVIENNPTLS